MTERLLGSGDLIALGGSIIRWEDPPAAERRGRRTPEQRLRWLRWMEELRENPRRWAVIEDGLTTAKRAGARQNSIRIAMRRRSEMDGLDFEVIARKLPDGTRAIFARYLPWEDE